MEKEEKNQQKGGNSNQPQMVINIQTAYNVNPAATEINNTFIIGSGKEATAAVKEALGAKPAIQFDNMKEPEVNIDITPIRTEILNYVSRVRPLLTEDAKSTFMKMWEDILSLPEVESKVYKAGKQWGTNFHRDLVANILYHLRSRKIYAVVYRDNYNGAALAEKLEGDKEHSVKHALRSEPPQDVRDAIDDMLKKKYEWL